MDFWSYYWLWQFYDSLTKKTIAPEIERHWNHGTWPKLSRLTTIHAPAVSRQYSFKQTTNFSPFSILPNIRFMNSFYFMRITFFIIQILTFHCITKFLSFEDSSVAVESFIQFYFYFSPQIYSLWKRSQQRTSSTSNPLFRRWACSGLLIKRCCHVWIKNNWFLQGRNKDFSKGDHTVSKWGHSPDCHSTSTPIVVSL